MTHLRTDVVQSPRVKRSMKVQSTDGFSIPESMANHVGTLSKKIDAFRSVSSATCVKDRFYLSTSPVRQRRAVKVQVTDDSTVEELLGVLEDHMKRCRMTVTDLFDVSNMTGHHEGVSAFRLRELLQTENLRFRQKQISAIIRLLDSDEDGLIMPIALETVLRRARFGQRAMTTMTTTTATPSRKHRVCDKSPLEGNARQAQAPDRQAASLSNKKQAVQDDGSLIESSELAALRQNLLRVIVKKVPQKP